jgi:hypothetical protein
MFGALIAMQGFTRVLILSLMRADIEQAHPKGQYSTQ